jgi:NADPH:quinone reductase-like Zn-dependent oxidoreductase
MCTPSPHGVATPVKRVVIHRPGGYDRLRTEEGPDAAPGPGEVAVDVAAFGINYADCVVRMGLYAATRELAGYPITPGFEVAGIVAAVGEGVTPSLVGTPVMAITLFGGYTSRLVIPYQQVFPLPAGWTHLQAAAFPAVFLTAWTALFELAHLHAGDTVLVHSAAGGVGGALVQLARLAGCRVVGVVGGAHKVDAVRALGAEEVIDKSSQPLWEEARRVAPDGYHVVLDANGAATLAESYRHLAAPGKLVVYGFHSMLPKRGGRPRWPRLAWAYLRTPRFSPLQLTRDNRSVLGFNLSFLATRTGLIRHGMEQLLAWIDAGKIQPPTVTPYPWDAVADAHRDLESGTTVGKLVVTTGRPDLPPGTGRRP